MNDVVEFQIGQSHITLYHGDCLEIMPTLETGSVDAVITDPPYGNNTNYASYDDTRKNLTELVEAFMPEVLRISKLSLITCGVANILLYPETDWILSWVNPSGVGSSKWGFACWQPILAYGKDPYLMNGLGRRPDTFFQKKSINPKNDHPVSKPINVMEWIVMRGSMIGDLILDPFMGSGTTGIAAVQTGRNFIGIELDAEYFEIAVERIRNAQPPLFVEDAESIEDESNQLMLDGLSSERE